MSNVAALSSHPDAQEPALLRDATLFNGLEPHDIVARALRHAARPLISTNFRPRSAALLHLVTRLAPDIPVIWVDTGYNTNATYRFAEEVTARLKLNVQVYTPRVSSARRYSVFNGVPSLDHPAHADFTREVKLEPFERALREWNPDVWFTGIRGEQTDFRKQLGVVSRGPLGATRVAPFFAWTAVDQDDYLYEHGLPDYDDYYDPTKGNDRRECGLQHLGQGI